MRGHRGVALVIVLLLGLVMITMLKALVIGSRSRTFQTRVQHDRIACLYVTEAGLADALTRLEADPDWVEGFLEKSMPRVDGSYTITFHTGAGAVGADESVNNLSNPSPADGFLGPLTVPPQTAELVLKARVGQAERVVAATIGRGESPVYPYAMMSSRNIVLRGDVRIDGIKSNETQEPTPAGIHSNRSDPSPDIITWSGEPGQRAQISGEVSVSSQELSSIDFGDDPSAYSVTGGFSAGAPKKTIPEQDIPTLIAANNSLPAPEVVPLGLTELASGKYFQDGDLVLQGDLELGDATLYVDGDLKVNGSISGTGAVYVGGESHLKGDARVLTTNNNGVALFSQGSVYLQGFDGTEYLEDLASTDPQVSVYLKDIKETMQDLQALFDTRPPAELIDGTSGELAVELRRRVLGDDTQSSPVWQDRTRNASAKLAAVLQTQPAGPTRDFLLKRLDHFERIFGDDEEQLRPPRITVQDWQDGTYRYYGYLDAVLFMRDVTLVPEMTNVIRQLDYDKLGTSHFQGIIYTNGFIHASQEVNVLGAVWVQDNYTQSARVVDGRELFPGDIYLDDGVRLTLNEDYIQTGGGVYGASPLAVRSWIER
ncbi:MAG: hypothetical protein HY319_21010 [Armatimonadetes bacterium]|nr:hypothetical protein [Armatimonadota bacterium]